MSACITSKISNSSIITLQAVAKLKEDTEKFFEIMTAVMYGHLTKGRDLMARMKLLKERISAGIAEFRAEMARLKIIQIRLQLLAEAGRASADEDHPISAADRKAAVAAVEELLDELIELEEGLRKQTETRETEGLQERLEEITAAMSKVVQALLL